MVSRLKAQRVSILGLLWLVLLSCQEHQWQRDQTCHAPCVEASCTAIHPCAADVDCPLGTGCFGDRGCRPRTSIDLPSNALVKGFGAGELELTRQAEGFSVEAPKAAVNVSCGLFVGSPEFVGGAIQNFQAAIARYHVFPLDPSRTGGSVLGLGLDDLKPLPESEACHVEAALNAGSPGFTLVESLRLGCWAASLQRVVAASQLLNLDPSELPEYDTTPLESCNQAATPTDGSVCVRSPQIGVCENHQCRAAAGGTSTGGAGSRSADCSAQSDGVPCQLVAPGRGHCYAGNCLKDSILPPLVSASCSGPDSEWSNCFPSPLGMVGSCFNQLCRQRCHDDSDCMPDGAACVFPPGPSYLGACKSATEQAP